MCLLTFCPLFVELCCPLDRAAVSTVLFFACLLVWSAEAADVIAGVCGTVAQFAGWPKEACATTCEDCIKQGGVFCDKGRFTVEPAIFTSNTTGVCWPGTLLGPSDTEVDFALVKIQFFCDDPAGLARFGQCAVEGYVPWVVAAVLVGFSLSLCVMLCICCTRRRSRRPFRY